jgi:hypothetical protein
MSNTQRPDAEETTKIAWQTPTIEELDYTGTEAIPSPGPALIDGIFYTH